MFSSKKKDGKRDKGAPAVLLLTVSQHISGFCIHFARRVAFLLKYFFFIKEAMEAVKVLLPSILFLTIPL
jgi:hypothetical protein